MTVVGAGEDPDRSGRPPGSRALRLAGRGRGRPLGAVLLVGLLAGLLGPGLLDRAPLGLGDLRLWWFDLCQSLFPRARLSAPAVIVEVDEASLARHGQWPWPRTLVARLLDRIAAGGPAAIGVDIVMPEADRLSPDRLAGTVPGLDRELAARLARLPRNDAVLAAAVRRAPVVLGIAGLAVPEEGAGQPAGRRTPVLARGGDPQPFVRHFAGALRSVDEIHAAAAGHGLLNPDAEGGVVRRMPLVAAAGGALVPALGVELLRVAGGAAAVAVRVGERGVEAVGTGDLLVPTRPDGTVWLHYGPHDPARFVSAAAVLDGGADPAQFGRKLVLLGVTAIGLGDHHGTPVAARMPGVEIHAQLLEAIFDGALLARPRWAVWLEAALLAAGGVLLLLAVPAWPVRASTGLALAVATALVGTSFLLYRRLGLLVDVALPGVGLGLLFTAMLGVTLAEANGQRRALRRQVRQEREAAARLAGELAAARRIQMGILPDAASAFPGESRFRLWALLEPARVVGGDLYDFFRLDPDRVFLLIGDVSGKGLPGSLFMAVSKTLCKSTALRRGADVGAVLTEANAEISRDNPEALFVTVFAAVLDAGTGRLEYVSAGHEAPWLVAADGSAVSRLGGAGGPPLCVVEDFPYAASARQLRPGETLVLVTDGLTEATNPAGELYGRARLETALGGLEAGTPVDEVGRAIRQEAARFVAGAEPSDDVAILVLRWHGPGGAVSGP